MIINFLNYFTGKLQALNNLLRRLKIGKHRVLIFTQMTSLHKKNRQTEIYKKNIN